MRYKKVRVLDNKPVTFQIIRLVEVFEKGVCFREDFGFKDKPLPAEPFIQVPKKKCSRGLNRENMVNKLAHRSPFQEVLP